MILASLWANSTNALQTPGQDGYSVVALNGNGITTPLGYEYFTNIQALIRGGPSQCTIDWPSLGIGQPGTNSTDVTFVTYAGAGTAPSTSMMVSNYDGYSPTVTWHWGDTNATDTGLTANHTFPTSPGYQDVYYTNYVTVSVPSAVKQFGTTGGEQHVVGVYSVPNFTQLYKLYFYEDSLSDLSLANCPSTLLQLHLAKTAVTNCDQWFTDVAAWTPHNVTNQATLFYPRARPQERTDWLGLLAVSVPPLG